MCEHTIGLRLGQPLMLCCLSSFLTVVCISDIGSTYVGACTKDKWINLFVPSWPATVMPPKMFSLWYVFVPLRIVCFVLFCVSWHRWSPSGSHIKRVSFQVLVWFNRWLNQFFLPMSPSHRFSHLWVATPGFFSIPKLNPMAKSAIGSCSSTSGVILIKVKICVTWTQLYI